MAVEIEFGGKVRELFYGIKELKELENRLGAIPMGAVMTHLSQIGISAITAALYVGLKDDDKSLTPNLIDKMLDDYIRPVEAGGEGKRIKVLADALSEALDATGLFKAADGLEEEGAEGNARGRRRSRSGSSGPKPTASASSD
jgi:hypothetical protein